MRALDPFHLPNASSVPGVGITWNILCVLPLPVQ